jgi:hypothetical protein
MLSDFIYCTGTQLSDNNINDRNYVSEIDDDYYDYNYYGGGCGGGN